MKRRLLAFIKRLLPRCGAQIFKGDSYTMQEWRYGWGDPHCTRPKWHKGPISGSVLATINHVTRNRVCIRDRVTGSAEPIHALSLAPRGKHHDCAGRRRADRVRRLVGGHLCPVSTGQEGDEVAPVLFWPVLNSGKFFTCRGTAGGPISLLSSRVLKFVEVRILMLAGNAPE